MSTQELAPADAVDGRIMVDVSREYGMGAGAVKGALRFDAPSSEEECETRADEAALEARRRAAQE